MAAGKLSLMPVPLDMVDDGGMGFDPFLASFMPALGPSPLGPDVGPLAECGFAKENGSAIPAEAKGV
jgi:hypothetical protein